MIDDIKTIETDNCEEYLIPENIIKTSIKEEKQTDKIFLLNNLDKKIIKIDKLKPLEEKTYSIRVWVTSNSLTAGSNLHYHGKIKVEEIK